MIVSVNREDKTKFPLISGFSLVVVLVLMVLLIIIMIGLLSVSSIELRRVQLGDAREVARANARMGMVIALGELQRQMGDDRRVSANGSNLRQSRQGEMLGVWDSWSPKLSLASGEAGGVGKLEYGKEKQRRFRRWMVSRKDEREAVEESMHQRELDGEVLFSVGGSGYELRGQKVEVEGGGAIGGYAWAVVQENTKAKLNIGVDEAKRWVSTDQLQTPSRPNFANSMKLWQPSGGWVERADKVTSLEQAGLDGDFGLSPRMMARLSKDYTVGGMSVLSDVVDGGLKVDLSTAFELSDTEFHQREWQVGGDWVENPFYQDGGYRGQRVIYQPQGKEVELWVKKDGLGGKLVEMVSMNGVPTYDHLRNYYRIYRHLYDSRIGDQGTTVFERPYQHIGMKRWGDDGGKARVSQGMIAPVLDRCGYYLSLGIAADGGLGVLVTPVVTLWNPYNISLETEGVVVYPWREFPVHCQVGVRKADGTRKAWYDDRLSRAMSEGVTGQGRDDRPYFYLHLTEKGQSVKNGVQTIAPAIRLAPGEVRVFCLAEKGQRNFKRGAAVGVKDRTWRMKPVTQASDLAQSLKSGIFLKFADGVAQESLRNERFEPGDIVESGALWHDDRGGAMTCMVNSWPIKHGDVELMEEPRLGTGGVATLDSCEALRYYSRTQAGVSDTRKQERVVFPRFGYESLKESPRLVGCMMMYHRTTESERYGQDQTMAQSDLMMTTNPRQHANEGVWSGFDGVPHYEMVVLGGNSWMSLAMETTVDGKDAYYGESHHAGKGRTHPVCFELPRSPILSLGALQHCDVAMSPYSVANQIGNSWATPYMEMSQVSARVDRCVLGNAVMEPGFAVYDYSYLVNESLFDRYYFSGAAPKFGLRKSGVAGEKVWQEEFIHEEASVVDVLDRFFRDCRESPLRNPRMVGELGGRTVEGVMECLVGSARCLRLAEHLMVEGGFNVNSTSEEAWLAVLTSLRDVYPAVNGNTPMSRFRYVLQEPSWRMRANDGWCGFRSLTDRELKVLAKKVVEQVKARGPFLSLGEFVNRRISKEISYARQGALQAAIEASGVNQTHEMAEFGVQGYPYGQNLVSPYTGVNTPGWLTQADVLNGLASTIAVRSDSFVIRSMGECVSSDRKRVLARVRLEATVQRVPEWLDASERASVAVDALQSPVNRVLGRRFRVLGVREIAEDQAGLPLG